MAIALFPSLKLNSFQPHRKPQLANGPLFKLDIHNDALNFISPSRLVQWLPGRSWQSAEFEFRRITGR
ncbi:MAG TPA: hypothetical protein VK305_03525, partial [Roseateles sp.]|nr:hypothetical protein [Roseateles sp.]